MSDLNLLAPGPAVMTLEFGITCTQFYPHCSRRPPRQKFECESHPPSLLNSQLDVTRLAVSDDVARRNARVAALLNLFQFSRLLAALRLPRDPHISAALI